MTLSFAEVIIPLKLKAERLLEELVRDLETGQKIKIRSSGKDYEMPFFVIPHPDKADQLENYLVNQGFAYERMKKLYNGFLFDDFKIIGLTC